MLRNYQKRILRLSLARFANHCMKARVDTIEFSHDQWRTDKI